MDHDSMEVDSPSYHLRGDGKTEAYSTLYPRPASLLSTKRTYAAFARDAHIPEPSQSLTNLNTRGNVKFRMTTFQRGEIPPLFRDTGITGTTKSSPASKIASPFARKYPNLDRVIPQSPAQRQEVDETIAKAQHPLRRIGGMVTSLYTYGYLLLASVWALFAGNKTSNTNIERIAVETDSTGSKRRAIEVPTPSESASASAFSPSPPASPPVATSRLVGSFPDTSPDTILSSAPAEASPVTFVSGLINTPPDSRPGSSHSIKQDSPMAGQFPEAEPEMKAACNDNITSQLPMSALQLNDTTSQPPAIVPQQHDIASQLPIGASQQKDAITKEKVEATQKKLVQQLLSNAKLHVTEKDMTTHVTRPYVPRPIVKESTTELQQGASSTMPRRLAPPTLESVTRRDMKSSQKDAAVDGLVDKFRRSCTDPPEVLAFKEVYRARKMYELEAEELEKMRLAREKEEREELERDKQERAQMRYQVRLKEAHDEAAKKAKEKKQEDEKAQQKVLKVFEETKKRTLKKAEETKLRVAQQAVEARLQEEKEAQKARLAAEKEAQQAAEAEEARLADEAKRRDPEWIKKQTLIRPLDPEWETKVEQIMAIKCKDSVVAKTVDGSDIHRHDIGSLVPPSSSDSNGKTSSPWLNDEIVNGIVSAIVGRKLDQTGYVKGSQNVPAYAFLPSMWYNNATKSGIESIKNWTRRRGIKGPEKLFQCEKVFLPVNTGVHWLLLIIGPKDRTLEVLDSLNFGKSRSKLFGLAREWLAMELGKAYVPEEWRELASRSAMQGNSDDCGVFTCFNALAAAKGYDYSVVGQGSMTDARRTLAAVLLNSGFVGDFEL